MRTTTAERSAFAPAAVLVASVLALSAGAAAQSCTAEWSAIGEISGTVRALAVYNDGSGPALYAGGAFATAGALSVNGIAKWDGQSWLPLGDGMNGQIWSFAVIGTDLYAGGTFTAAGGESASRIARWNGQAWSRLGTEAANGTNNTVSALAVWDGELYTGGTFTSAGGVAGRNRVARWDPITETWSALGTGIPNSQVFALAVYNDGSGPALFAGGTFTQAGSVTGINRMAKWDGQDWSALIDAQTSGVGVNGQVNALSVFDDGNGEGLFAGGQFTSAASTRSVARIARWNGQVWSGLDDGNGFPIGVSSTVRTLAVFDGGSGPALHFGGDFTTAGALTAAARIVRWNHGNQTWSALGAGIDNQLHALAVFDGALHAGGTFLSAGGVPAERIARWGCPPAPPCYANCDDSTTPPILNVEDFTCFINAFSAGSLLTPAEQETHYANCDGSTTEPVLNVEDFACFINQFAAGCP